MRIRKKKWAEPELAECRYYTNEPEQYRGRWKVFFGNDKPIELEIGCGKCTFIAEKALRDPDTNYIAMDIKSDMLGVGRRNIERIFAEAGKNSPDNVALVRCNVEEIDKVFSADDGIAVMYINFCNPWPRLKHQKRRLTYPRKLRMYRDFLTEDAVIYFKTDDELFEDSVGYFEEAGYHIRYITRDLHNSEVEGNIVTEHEQMFTDEGIPIKYLEATV